MNTTPTTCPQCGREARGLAFPTTRNYLRDSVGHVFTNPETEEDE